jgi:uncharacterized membrane protein (UPF0136 family)
MTSANLILIIYVVLLIAGGLVGFLKAKSKPSLIMSSVFALLLIIAEFVIPRGKLVADILIFVLLIFFGMRFARGRKFMPAGLMVILSAGALALRFFV